MSEVNSIEMKIAKIAAENWGQEEPKNLEEAKGITWGSEVSAVKGMIEVLKLNPEMEEKIMDEVYTKDVLSDEISTQIKAKHVNPKDIVNMLSVIHDGWVKSNPNKFMQEGRNKEYQFAPLMLLDWKEAKSDLLFLKPILEGAGIEFDEKDIQEQFDLMQKDFMIKKNLFSHEVLARTIASGSKFYPALEGLETQNGGSIDGLLQNSVIVEKMTKQIEDRVPIKSREDFAVDIIKSSNENLDEIFWIETSRDGVGETKYFPTINGPISKREIMLSKTIGKPYPTYILGTERTDRGDTYTTKLREPNGFEWNAVNSYELSVNEGKKEAQTLETDKKGKVEFGLSYDISGPEKMKGRAVVSKNELLLAGLNPEDMGWEEETIITRKADKKEFAKSDIIDMILDNNDDEIGYVTTDVIEKDGYGKENKKEPEVINKPISKKMYKLGVELGVGFPQNISSVTGARDVEDLYHNTYKTFEEASETEKEEVQKRIEKIEKLRSQIANDKTGKYDKPGKISVPVFKTNDGYYSQDIPKAELIEMLEIDATQRELAEAGILPEDFKWKEQRKTKISSKDIAEADKETALTTAEVGFFGRLINKIKVKFQGKGEK